MEKNIRQNKTSNAMERKMKDKKNCFGDGGPTIRAEVEERIRILFGKTSQNEKEEEKEK